MTEQVPEYTSSLLASGCMPKLKGENNTIILRTDKVKVNAYADDDLEIVFEKLVKNKMKDNARIGRKTMLYTMILFMVSVSFVSSASFYIFVVILF